MSMGAISKKILSNGIAISYTHIVSYQWINTYYIASFFSFLNSGIKRQDHFEIKSKTNAKL